MTQTPAEIARQEQREQLLAEAISLFAEVGEQAFSIRKLAARIDRAQTVVYRHFASKDDVLGEVVEHGFARLYATLPELSDDPREQLLAIGRHYLEFGLANGDLYQLMFDTRPRFLFAVGDDERKLRRIQLLDVAASALADLGISLAAEPAALADALWAQIHGLLALHHAHPEFTAERAREAYAALTQLLDLID